MNKHRQSGLTMIEILIAIFIMAVGLLGTMTLQMRAVQDTGNANLRSVAIYLANDMADRIRANKAGRTAGTFNNMTNAKDTNIKSACYTTAGCSGADMALHELSEWRKTVEDSNILPDGDANISANGGVYTVTVSWSDRVKKDASKASAEATSSVALTFDVY